MILCVQTHITESIPEILPKGNNKKWVLVLKPVGLQYILVNRINSEFLSNMFDKHIIIVDNEGRNRYNKNTQKEPFCIMFFVHFGGVQKTIK